MLPSRWRSSLFSETLSRCSVTPKSSLERRYISKRVIQWRPIIKVCLVQLQIKTFQNLSKITYTTGNVNKTLTPQHKYSIPVNLIETMRKMTSSQKYYPLLFFCDSDSPIYCVNSCFDNRRKSEILFVQYCSSFHIKCFLMFIFVYLFKNKKWASWHELIRKVSCKM